MPALAAALPLSLLLAQGGKDIGVRAVAETQLESGENGIELPIDQSGALYVVDWSTSEGHDYSLVLRDGATGQTAASVQVKSLQNQGRFLFVGYRLE